MGRPSSSHRHQTAHRQPTQEHYNWHLDQSCLVLYRYKIFSLVTEWKILAYSSLIKTDCFGLSVSQHSAGLINKNGVHLNLLKLLEYIQVVCMVFASTVTLVYSVYTILTKPLQHLGFYLHAFNRIWTCYIKCFVKIAKSFKYRLVRKFSNTNVCVGCWSQTWICVRNRIYHGESIIRLIVYNKFA